MKKILLTVIAMATLLGACQKLPTGPGDIPDTTYSPRTELGKMVSEAKSVAHIYADTTFIIARGVDETDIHLQTTDYKVEHVFILRVNLAEPSLKMKVVLPDNKDAYVVGARQTPTDMIEFVDKPGARVVAAVNGDFWDTSNGKTRGPLHKDGSVLKDDFFYSPTLTDQAISFFGLNFDNVPYIRPAEDYLDLQGDMRDLTGSGVIVVRDGVVPTDFSGYSTNRHPRNVVGYTADGKTLYFMIVDGRQATWSDGMLYWEEGEIMTALGCDWASNLDGGGSAMLVIRHPTVNTFQLRNRACDNPGVGAERAVVNCWMVTVNEP
ncbi:MAG: phosphodiester glycosidase family protein [Bacteroidales bacterium]|nr:phosphodiester glycosidase family protein [Bacteroidales bacterium]